MTRYLQQGLALLLSWFHSVATLYSRQTRIRNQSHPRSDELGYNRPVRAGIPRLQELYRLGVADPFSQPADAHPRHTEKLWRSFNPARGDRSRTSSPPRRSPSSDALTEWRRRPARWPPRWCPCRTPKAGGVASSWPIRHSSPTISFYSSGCIRRKRTELGIPPAGDVSRKPVGGFSNASFPMAGGESMRPAHPRSTPRFERTRR